MDRCCRICSRPIPATMAWNAAICSAKCQREHDKIRARERRQQLRDDGTSQWQLRKSNWTAEQWDRFRTSKRISGGRDRSDEYAALHQKGAQQRRDLGLFCRDCGGDVPKITVRRCRECKAIAKARALEVRRQREATRPEREARRRAIKRLQYRAYESTLSAALRLYQQLMNVPSAPSPAPKTMSPNREEQRYVDRIKYAANRERIRATKNSYRRNRVAVCRAVYEAFQQLEFAD